jgi:integrase
MPSLIKRKGSDNWYYRRKIPKKVLPLLDKLPTSQRPRNWSKAEIMISLGTPDRAKAKAKYPEVAAEVEKRIEALKQGPKPLSNKQVAALSGKLYKGITHTLEDNPVADAAQWLRVAEVNEAARRGEFGRLAILGIHKDPAAKRQAALEDRFGKLTDAFLSEQGIITDDGSRWALIERLSVDLSHGARKLARNADGDYSPDEYVKRFPEFEAATQPAEAKRSLTALVQEWHKAAPGRQVKKTVADRIKARFEKLITFLKHDDVERVTRHDIIRWVDHRQANKIATKTINDSDIASFNNVFNWGVDREWLTHNPAKGVKAKGKKPVGKPREEYFTPDEAKAVLLQAASVIGTPKENPKTTAAKRWVPWLCAYSGARVAEMIQLRKKDIRKDAEHGWIIRLDPEAGSIKTNKPCDVPVHEHLIAAGFIDFVNGAASGHLFCDIGKDGTIAGPASGVYKRVYKMVREVIKDPKVQPNHAWRYTFKTYGLEAGLSDHVLDAITNHTPKHQGGRYTKATLKARADAMAKFPRYDLG